MPKDEGNPSDEIRKGESAANICIIRTSWFIRRSSFVLRDVIAGSDFGHRQVQNVTLHAPGSPEYL